MACVVIAVVGITATALAYFTSTGSGTGSASVGSASSWTVTPGTATGGPLYPGAGSLTIPYTVTNPGSGAQSLQGTTASVASSGGNVTENGTAVAGCLASWFTATNTHPTLGVLASGGSVTDGSVSVTMANADADQNACQGVKPDITINAS